MHWRTSHQSAINRGSSLCRSHLVSGHCRSDRTSRVSLRQGQPGENVDAVREPREPRGGPGGPGRGTEEVPTRGGTGAGATDHLPKQLRQGTGKGASPRHRRPKELALHPRQPSVGLHLPGV